MIWYYPGMSDSTKVHRVGTNLYVPIDMAILTYHYGVMWVHILSN